MASVNSTSGGTHQERGELGAYIQFGCGLSAPATWLNFDAGPAFWIESNLPFLKPVLLKRGFPDYPANIRYGNVITGLPRPARIRTRRILLARSRASRVERVSTDSSKCAFLLGAGRYVPRRAAGS